MTLLLAAVLLATPEVALEAAIRCYDDLDYACAEERLAEALAGGLAGEDRERARLYEALLATAFRDEPRARRAVRALLGIDPAYDPGPRVPPRLRALFEELRPPPVPPPIPLARVDVTSILLFGQDAEQWTDGLGGELGGGVRLFGWLALGATLGYSDHGPGIFAYRGLTLAYGSAEVGWRGDLGPLRFMVGVSIGAAQAESDRGVLGDDVAWGALTGIPIDLSWPIWEGLGLGLRAVPTSFVTTDADQFAASFLLPVGVGLRYGR